MFIKLRDGLLVKSESIEAIEETDMTTTKIYTSNRIYEINMPIQFVEELISAKEGNKESTEDMLRGVLKYQQHFAG